MNAVLKNLGANLRQMMAEDWRGEDERNTLGMAGYWLEMLSEDQKPKCSTCGLELLTELESGMCILCEESWHNNHQQHMKNKKLGSALWLPIKTAPRDGTEIIVGFYSGSVWFVHVAWWRELEDWMRNDPQWSEEDVGWWSYTKYSLTQEKLEGHRLPTHWMPLPSQPNNL